MKLLDVILIIVLLLIGGPLLLTAIAALSGIILPLGFVCICLWWMLGPRKEEEEVYPLRYQLTLHGDWLVGWEAPQR